MNKAYKSLLIIVFLFDLVVIRAQISERKYLDADIECIPLHSNSFILISYANLKNIGRIGTNHLLYIKNNKAFLFDSPNDNLLAGKIYQLVKDSLKAEIKMMSVSHWHQDHSGGLDTLNKLGVQTFSYFKTRDLMQQAGLAPALYTFSDSIHIDFEGTDILLAYCGAAHTADNIIGWIASEKLLFSGSIIRCMENTNLGYIKDADLQAWPQTVENIKRQFGNASLIITGHGNAGGAELIGHTFSLLSDN
jgi:metallo-beta-lactamase class B